MKENQKNGIRLPFWIGLIIFVSLIMFSLQRGYILRHAHDGDNQAVVAPVVQKTNAIVVVDKQNNKKATIKSVNHTGNSNDIVDIQFTGLKMK